MWQWFFNVGVWLDQGINVLLGGWPDETISARAHRMQFDDTWNAVRSAINAVFFWEDDHCKASYEAELLRRQYPPEYREGYR